MLADPLEKRAQTDNKTKHIYGQERRFATSEQSLEKPKKSMRKS